MKSLVSFLVLLFVATVQAISTTGSRLLVILDDVADKDKYSTFLGDLSSRGFEINYETPKSESLSLFRLGERMYDHVILLPTKIKGLGPNLTPNHFVDFMNANGNVLLALSSEQSVPSSVVSFLTELEITLPADRTGLVVDHFHYDTSSPDKHDVLLLPPPLPVKQGVHAYFAPKSRTPELLALPRGVGHTLGQSALLNPVLRAPPTAYSFNPKEQGDGVDPNELFATGAQLGLVSTFQARNSARVTVLGSAEMLQDQWFDAKVKPVGGEGSVGTWNREFAKRVAGWTFQEIGVIKVNWIEHRLNEAGASDEVNPKIYRIKNDVAYTISISEHMWDRWGAYLVPDGDDLQLEFSMLSPFHRLRLSKTKITPQACTYSVSFRLPDQHGIFNFMVNYKRPFVTSLEEKNTVTVRHMAHDEFTRSFDIPAAWPWISGIGATVVGFLAFCAVFMFSKPTNAAQQSKKK